MRQQTMDSLKKIIKEEIQKRETLNLRYERELNDIGVLETTVFNMNGNVFSLLELPESEMDRMLHIAFQAEAGDVLQQINYIRSLYRRLGSGKETSFNLEMYKTELDKISTTLKERVKVSQKMKLAAEKQQALLLEELKKYQMMLEHLEKHKKGALPNTYLLLPSIDSKTKNYQEKYQICLELLEFNNAEGTKKRAALLDKYAALKEKEFMQLLEKAVKERLGTLQVEKQTYTNFLEEIKFSNSCVKKIQKRSFDFICNFSIPELEKIVTLAHSLLKEEISISQLKVVQYLVAGMRAGLEITLTEPQFDLVNQLFHVIDSLQHEMKEKQKQMEASLRSLGEEIRSLQEFEKKMEQNFHLSDNEILKQINVFFQNNEISYEYQYEFLKDFLEQKEL